MKTVLASVLALGLMTSFAHAEETVKESAENAGHKMGHTMKKGVNRVKEAVCMEGDLKCAGKKGQHRMEETGDAIGNKAKEIKDKVD